MNSRIYSNFPLSWKISLNDRLKIFATKSIWKFWCIKRALAGNIAESVWWVNRYLWEPPGIFLFSRTSKTIWSTFSHHVESPCSGTFFVVVLGLNKFPSPWSEIELFWRENWDLCWQYCKLFGLIYQLFTFWEQETSLILPLKGRRYILSIYTLKVSLLRKPS